VGGREHDVSLDESTGRWVKFTKPAACGYTVTWDSAGTPYAARRALRGFLKIAE
jgi:hypothetical protein